MKKSSIEIFETRDYSLFKYMKGNRHVDKKKIHRIRKSVEEDGLNYFQWCPIMVTPDMQVIDGQHRLKVCEQLNLPVYFVVVPGFNLKQVPAINNNVSKWKDQDFLNCYMDLGNKHYQLLHEFIQKHGINIGIAVSLLQDGKVHGHAQDTMRDGLFKVNHQDYATRFMKIIEAFDGICKTNKTRSFMQAVEVLAESKSFSLDDFMKKIQAHNLVIESRGTYKEYLTHMEDLYNYRNQTRRRIY
jgi:hypothetical protein